MSSSSSFDVNRPRMCRACGAIIGAGEVDCAVCGADAARTGGAVSAENRQRERTIEQVKDAHGEELDDSAVAQMRRMNPGVDDDTLRFAYALFRRPAAFTIIMLIANIAVFLVTLAASGREDSFVALNINVLVTFGAKLNFLINQEGQWWRFIAPIFLHGGIVHLLMNMYGLWMLGPYVEKIYGSARFVVFWVVSGIAGVAASYYSVQPELAQSNFIADYFFKTGDAPSVGASGALFGLIGALFVFGIKFRHELPPGFKQMFGVGMLPTILLNVMIGFYIPAIDNAAHFGGLVAGALLAALTSYKRIGKRAPVAYLWHFAQLAAICLVVFVGFKVARNAAATPPVVSNLQARLSGDFTFGAANPMEAVARYFQFTNIDAALAFNRGLEGDAVLVNSNIETIKNAREFDAQEARQRAELIRLLEQARDFGQRPEEQRRTQRAIAERNQLVESFDQLQQQRSEWFQANAPNFGFQIQQSQPAPQNPSAPQPTSTPTK